MNYSYLYLLLVPFFFFFSCGDQPNAPKPPGPDGPKVSGAQDKVLFDFVYVGCNRVTHHDGKYSNKTDASKANLAQLRKIYAEVSKLPSPPEYFFFLGDMVLGESDTTELRKELKQWVVDFNDKSPGGINEYWNNNIKMIAIPGNHEMLTEDANYNEFPLLDAIKIWNEEMKDFIPTNVTVAPGQYQDATYSFQHLNTFFVVMNTDTYNSDLKNGQVPVSWIENQLTTARGNSSIKHILLLGHKPAYGSSSNGVLEKDAAGLATMHSGYVDQLWSTMQTTKCAAMLSAHKHKYDRFQPNGTGSYQVIAGNGGSLVGENGAHDHPSAPHFFGYSHIYVMSSGALIHVSRGWQIDVSKYLNPVPPSALTCTYDSLNIEWGRDTTNWTFVTGMGKNCRKGN